MAHRGKNGRRETRKLGRKSYRSAEKALLRGGRARTVRPSTYHTPHSMRKDTLPDITE